MSDNQPVSNAADVLATWSGDLSAVQVAPVRDAIVNGQLASQLAYQDASSYAAAQSDSLRAADEYLDEIGSYERGIKRGAGELDGPYRDRVNAIPTPCDPNDIIAAANAVLAPYTNISCRYAERADGAFPGQPHVFGVASTVWSMHAFADPRSALYTAADGGAGATPNYPDRYYDTITNRRPPGVMPCGLGAGPASWPVETNPLAVRALPGLADVVALAFLVSGTGTSWLSELTSGEVVQLSIGPFSTLVEVNAVLSDNSFSLVNQWLGVTVGAMTVSLVSYSSQAQCDEYGRWFLLRVPDVSGIDSNVSAVYQLGNPQPPESPLGGGGIFPGNTSDGVAAFTGSYVWNYNQTSAGVYQSVVDSVEALRGHGIRWSLISDPILTT